MPVTGSQDAEKVSCVAAREWSQAAFVAGLCA
jgi:hypothetical protein